MVVDLDVPARRLGKISLWAIILSCLLTCTSRHWWLNLIIAIPIVFGIYSYASGLQVRVPDAGDRGVGFRRIKRRAQSSARPQRSQSSKSRTALQGGVTDPSAWREKLGNPVVEDAWRKLCGSILQEWVYDAWYGLITPDQEFTHELRVVVNGLFGEVALRAKGVNLVDVITNELPRVVADAVGVYRETKKSIGEQALQSMDAKARDKAFRQEMKCEGLLVGPLDSSRPGGNFKALTALSEGILSLTMPLEDFKRPILRSVCRELVAGCVLRPVMGFFSPAFINRQLMSFAKMLPPPPVPSQQDQIRRKEGEHRYEKRFSEFQEGEAAAALKRDESGRSARARKQPSKPPLAAETAAAGRPSGSVSSLTGSASGQSAFTGGGAQGDASLGGTVRVPRLAGEPHGGAVMGAVVAAAPPPGPGSTALRRKYFEGRARAAVVVAENHTGPVHSASKDFVVYKIRVGDATGEWTVARRFRNFETLHQRLRQHSKRFAALNTDLPKKSFFFSRNTDDKVESRRQGLHTYLAGIMADSQLAKHDEVWEFLAPHSDVYDLETPTIAAIAKSKINGAVNTAKTNVGLAGTTAQIYEQQHGVTPYSSRPGSMKDLQLPPTRAPAAPSSGGGLSPLESTGHSIRGSACGSPTSVASRSAQEEEAEAPPSPVSTSGRSHAGENGLGEASAGWQPDETDTFGLFGDLVDFLEDVFQLNQGSYSRKIGYAAMRQTVHVLGGDSLDRSIIKFISDMRQPHQIALAIETARGVLWPGGVWFMHLPPYAERAVEAYKLPPDRLPQARMEDYLSVEVDPDDGAARAAREVLTKHVLPSAVTKLLGKKSVEAAMEDIWHISQSPTFMLQVGYGVLKVVVDNVFPEISEAFEDIIAPEEPLRG